MEIRRHPRRRVDVATIALRAASRQVGDMTKRIAFLGLGVMGAPMAGHLARAGHRVTVYNRTSAKAEEWVARHAADGFEVASAATPSEAAHGQDVVITCVGNDDDLADVVLGE